MAGLAIIGGTGLTSLEGLEIVRREVVNTPWGEPSGAITHGALAAWDVMFLPRHGNTHRIPPHKVNYRANMWALKQVGAQQIIAVAAVGGIDAQLNPGRLVFPDQIVDYTWSRGHTFFEDDLAEVVHVDFTEPYTQALRERLIRAARDAGLDAKESGTYGATQGPRLESAAEIDRMERDGCDIVGMTGMPEAALARELALEYATCAVVSNRAAGRGEATVELADIKANLAVGMRSVRSLLEKFVEAT